MRWWGRRWVPRNLASSAMAKNKPKTRASIALQGVATHRDYFSAAAARGRRPPHRPRRGRSHGASPLVPQECERCLKHATLAPPTLRAHRARDWEARGATHCQASHRSPPRSCESESERSERSCESESESERSDDEKSDSDHESQPDEERKHEPERKPEPERKHDHDCESERRSEEARESEGGAQRDEQPARRLQPGADPATERERVMERAGKRWCAPLCRWPCDAAPPRPRE